MKKIILACMFFLSAICLLQNCKKVTNEAKPESSPGSQSSALINKERMPSKDETITLNHFLETQKWAEFTKDNPKLMKSVDLTKATAVTSYSVGFRANLTLIYLPINNGLNDSYLVLSARETDYKADNFINFVILFQKNISSTSFLDRKYSSGDLEIYGYNSTLQIREVEKNGSVSCTSTWLNTSGYLKQPIEVNSSVPSGECVSQSYDNQVADCTGWCHIAFELDVTLVMHAAFATTAALWCSTHNNSPWNAPQ
jgi:hypothetical protein